MFKLATKLILLSFHWKNKKWPKTWGCVIFRHMVSEVKWSESRSVVSNSLWPHGLYSPWNSLGQNTGMGSLSLLQGIFSNQGSSPGLPHCRQILYQLSHKGSPRILEWVAYPFSRGSSQPRNQIGVSWIAGGLFTNWAIRESIWWRWSIRDTHARTLCRFSHIRLCATLWTAAHQAPPSTGFSRQEYWSGLPVPSPLLEIRHPQVLSHSCKPMDCSLPGSFGFPRDGYWSGLPFPSPEDLPDPGIKPTSLALQVDSLPLSHQVCPIQTYTVYQNDIHCMVESEKVGLKLNIQKTKFMATGSITSWETDGETVETVSDFIFFWAPKSLQMVTAAMRLKDACSLEGKL